MSNKRILYKMHAKRRSYAKGGSKKTADRNLGKSNFVKARFYIRSNDSTKSEITFNRRAHFGEIGTVDRIEYDPTLAAFTALVIYEGGARSYILAPQRVKAGDKVVSGEQVDIEPGNAMPLGNMPVGTIVHNVELRIGKGGALARSPGSYAQIVRRDQSYVTLRLSSGEQRLVNGQCYATVGAVANLDHLNISLGKPARNRWLGSRLGTGHVLGSEFERISNGEINHRYRIIDYQLYNGDLSTPPNVKSQQLRAFSVLDARIKATNLFGSKKSADEWLSKPSPWLDNQSPLELINSGKGEEVATYLDQIECGVYV